MVRHIDSTLPPPSHGEDTSPAQASKSQGIGSDEAASGKLTPVEEIVKDLALSSIKEAAPTKGSKAGTKITLDKSKWDHLYQTWEAKPGNQGKTVEDFAAYFLTEGHFGKEDRLAYLYFAAITYLGEDDVKRLPNGSTIVRELEKEGREEKIRVYTPQVEHLGAGSSYTAEKVSGLSFVTRQGEVTTKGMRPYARLYLTKVAEGRAPFPEDIDPGFDTQIELHNLGRSSRQERKLHPAESLGVELDEKGELKGIGRGPTIISSAENYEKLYSSGSLAKFVKDYSPSPQVLLKGFRDVMCGERALAYFHAKHIDLTPMNIAIDASDPNHPKMKIRDFQAVNMCKPLTETMSPQGVLEEIKGHPFTVKKNFTPAYTLMSDGMYMTDLEKEVTVATAALENLLKDPQATPAEIEKAKNLLIDKWNAFLAPIEKFQVFLISISLFEALGGKETIDSNRSSFMGLIMNPISPDHIKKFVDSLSLPSKQKGLLTEFFEETIATPIEKRADSLEAFRLYENILSAST